MLLNTTNTLSALRNEAYSANIHAQEATFSTIETIDGYGFVTEQYLKERLLKSATLVRFAMFSSLTQSLLLTFLSHTPGAIRVRHDQNGNDEPIAVRRRQFCSLCTALRPAVFKFGCSNHVQTRLQLLHQLLPLQFFGIVSILLFHSLFSITESSADALSSQIELAFEAMSSFAHLPLGTSVAASANDLYMYDFVIDARKWIMTFADSADVVRDWRAAVYFLSHVFVLRRGFLFHMFAVSDLLCSC